MRNALVASCLVIVAGAASAAPPVKITVARGTEREQAAREQLERLLASNDLGRYTFTREVVIEEGARNHAFPVLTLNARFADSPDELLSSYLHEQIHWHLRERDTSQRRAVARLRRLYPAAPVGLPEGADTAYSTYGHLVTCSLEVQAIRGLLGPERAATVISRKPHYLWIYRTVLSDEDTIRSVVRDHGLGID
jgi:hypothetical protein